MEEMYGLHSTLLDYGEQQQQQQQQPLMLPGNMVTPADYQNLLCSSAFRDRIPIFGSDHLFSAASSALCETATGFQNLDHQGSSGGDMNMITTSTNTSLIKAKIASHPRYPCLLEAYIDCQK
ncbi:homeobox protein knotted-1-like, partial [Thalictrum thalictroides]